MEELEEEDWDNLDTGSAGSPGGGVEEDLRIILHFDMDCFYAQVEMIRNPALSSKPLGVQQKYLIVTCNYVARDRGVTKLMSVRDALHKCPDLVLVPGEDLTFYRDMSYKVTELLMSYCPLVERLGLDENFMDVTEMVESRRKNMDVSQLSFVGHIYGHDDVPAQSHVSLAVGSVIACELRGALFSTLGLTSCAGVAHNKLLAKLVSGTFKPNQQSTLLPHSVPQILLSLNTTSRVPGVGYRTVERLKVMGVCSVRDLQCVPVGRLVCEFGEMNAKRLHSLAHGVDHTPVTPSGPPQSLSDEDSFKKISTLSEAQSKITELLLSLTQRMCKDGRLPQTLRLTLRRSSAPSRWFSRESRQSPIPSHTAHRITNGCPEAGPQLVTIAMKLFHKLVEVREAFHLTLLNVCFTNLQIRTSTRNSISSFFTSTSTHTPAHTPSTHTPSSSFTQPEALCGSMISKHPSSSSTSDPQQPIRSCSSPSPIPDPSGVPAPPLPPDVDPDVFRVLPPHIQEEIMSSFHKAPPTAPPTDLIAQHGAESAHDVSAAADVPRDVDPIVFSQLPPDVQAELRTEWRRSKVTLKMSPRHTGRRSAAKRPAAKSSGLLLYFKPSSDKHS